MKKLEMNMGILSLFIEARKSKNSLINSILLLALLGGIFGTFFDYLHVITGTIHYTNPVFFGLAWNVPLLYIIASIAIGFSHPFLDKKLGRKEYLPVTQNNIIAGFIGLCLVWAATGILPFSSITVAIILFPVSLIIWQKIDGTKEGLIIAFITAFFGCLTEILLSYFGFFYHTHQDFLSIPYWLPAIYISASIGLGNIGRWLENNRN